MTKFCLPEPEAATRRDIASCANWCATTNLAEPDATQSTVATCTTHNTSQYVTDNLGASSYRYITDKNTPLQFVNIIPKDPHFKRISGFHHFRAPSLRGSLENLMCKHRNTISKSRGVKTNRFFTKGIAEFGRIMKHQRVGVRLAENRDDVQATGFVHQ
ncbi:hypothetical protein J6590_016419 [Homalodisca vitripennis]|nr:hypothetical protein J6590_016419 [Homalodisca vitripennis]